MSTGSDDPTTKLMSADSVAAAAQLRRAFQPGEDAGDRPGDQIARYRLMEKIGEGGFGTVWKAEQTEPISREVAVKLIRRGMDSREVVARFAAERQTLALLEHPNIAGVLDAGATDDGRPYFVMELIQGVTITEYGKDLSVREKLALLLPVCEAVQHAHQKGVIHRDLKPSNILVAKVDGKPTPKVIDFGIAKAMARQNEPAFADSVLLTREDAFIGTPSI